MKRFLILLTSVSALSVTGCVQTTFTKQVEVHRSPDGKITKIIETETITQPGYTSSGLQPDHLRHNQSDTEAVKIYH